MIVVIADDFSGAAEIGGLGLDYGLKSFISTTLNPDGNYDLLIIATDTRSMSEAEASQRTEEISGKLLNFDYSWIYKKVDSVMRGYILTELIAMLKTLHKERALLVPSNPALGRIITDGKYFVQNMLLEKTDFSKDPEFSSQTSEILELLGSSPEFKTCVLKIGEKIPEKCIVVGEAVESSHLKYWAAQITPDIIPAGAAAFFDSLLEVKGHRKIANKKQWRLKSGKLALYVLGSSYSNTEEAIRRALKHGCYVSEMPEALFRASKNREKLLEEWIDSILNVYRFNSRVVIAINKPIVHDRQHARRLRADFATVVKNIYAHIPLDELFIEGGATSYSIIKKLNFAGFIPIKKLAPGVIRMKIQSHPDLLLTIKPGSYSWPEEIWEYDCQ